MQLYSTDWIWDYYFTKNSLLLNCSVTFFFHLTYHESLPVSICSSTSWCYTAVQYCDKFTHVHVHLDISPLIDIWKWKLKVKSHSRVRLFATPWTVAYQASPSMGFSRQEYWSGLPFPSPGDLLDPGIEPGSPALQADALPSEPPGSQIDI